MSSQVSIVEAKRSSGQGPLRLVVASRDALHSFELFGPLLMPPCGDLTRVHGGDSVPCFGLQGSTSSACRFPVFLELSDALRAQALGENQHTHTHAHNGEGETLDEHEGDDLMPLLAFSPSVEGKSSNEVRLFNVIRGVDVHVLRLSARVSGIQVAEDSLFVALTSNTVHVYRVAVGEGGVLDYPLHTVLRSSVVGVAPSWLAYCSSLDAGGPSPSSPVSSSSSFAAPLFTGDLDSIGHMVNGIAASLYTAGDLAKREISNFVTANQNKSIVDDLSLMGLMVNPDSSSSFPPSSSSSSSEASVVVQSLLGADNNQALYHFPTEGYLVQSMVCAPSILILTTVGGQYVHVFDVSRARSSTHFHAPRKLYTLFRGITFARIVDVIWSQADETMAKDEKEERKRPQEEEEGDTSAAACGLTRIGVVTSNGTVHVYTPPTRVEQEGGVELSATARIKHKPVVVVDAQGNETVQADIAACFTHTHSNNGDKHIRNGDFCISLTVGDCLLTYRESVGLKEKGECVWQPVSAHGLREGATLTEETASKGFILASKHTSITAREAFAGFYPTVTPTTHSRMSVSAASEAKQSTEVSDASAWTTQPVSRKKKKKKKKKSASNTKNQQQQQQSVDVCDSKQLENEQVLKQQSSASIENGGVIRAVSLAANTQWLAD